MKKEEDETTTITIKKSTWKRLAQTKLDGEYSSFDEMLNEFLDEPYCRKVQKNMQKEWSKKPIKPTNSNRKSRRR